MSCLDILAKHNRSSLSSCISSILGMVLEKSTDALFTVQQQLIDYDHEEIRPSGRYEDWQCSKFVL
jgi:hypothetical protein